MKQRAGWHLVLAGAGALLGVACENDVSVRLLRPAPTPAPTTTTSAEPTPMPSASTPPIMPCIDGDPCSGLARALYFKAPYDRVQVPSTSLLDLPQDFTLEAWVLLKSSSGGHGVINRWFPGVGDIQLTFGTPEVLPKLELPTNDPVPSHVLATWAFVRPDYWLTLVSPMQPSVDEWHHLATSYGGGSFRLYIDGALANSVTGTDAVANPPGPLFIGASERHEGNRDPTPGSFYWPPIDGFIADVRLSSFDRYPEPFAPEQQLTADEQTLGLWRLDEGEGDTAHDSGPSQIDGKISGAIWALAPRRSVAMRPD